MSELHDLQARAGDFERAIAETEDQHGSLLSGLQSGLNQLRERLVAANAANDRLLRENTELRAIAEQLLGALENKPAETLHDKLAALDGQLHGLLELSGVQDPVNGTPVAGEGDGDASFKSHAEDTSGSGTGGPFDEIRDRMRALSSQLLASTAPAVADEAKASAPIQNLDSAPVPAADAAPKPPSEPRPRRGSGSPRGFDRPIRALAEKAQRVLPKARLRFDAETDYALGILRRIGGGRQPFGIEEVRELINGKFGLTLTDRDDAQLSASIANQDGLTRDPRGSNRNAPQSWRFETG